MAGETNVEELLRSMSAELVSGLFVFSTIADGVVPSGVRPKMIFEEAEGITLVLLKEEAEAEASGLAYEFPCRMITLNIHSSLDAVGFLARITAELAKQNMGINPVSGFYHDHLFVPHGRAQEALDVLNLIAKQA
ncbi:MAG: ACT domain-containing protein [Rhodobacteraceae bacterium]|nr:ACT domain-containing protein [Paracoccaceae bacterium]